MSVDPQRKEYMSVDPQHKEYLSERLQYHTLRHSINSLLNFN